jgi:hypothetical protein
MHLLVSKAEQKGVGGGGGDLILNAVNSQTKLSIVQIPAIV